MQERYPVRKSEDKRQLALCKRKCVDNIECNIKHLDIYGSKMA